ncbi:hypothetical protein EST38_g14218 [Candolleomyces aberdarensis]|uniref:Uncharacterized protein n=1 Tax=Candolleomyces aberdarensis TaxID=2316362 RepID=A0A4Q2CXV1_9AGAR|nr:hypothetical protein EST38_g14218 [Candolleomyces aberdarensis]
MAEDAGHGDDPFAIFLEPPENETSGDRATRESNEAEAKGRSDEIDEELKKEKVLMRTRRREPKVVLVGDSESGRPNMVKQLRMSYVREEWLAEREKYTSVIRLTILKAAVTILDALQSELDGEALAEASDGTQSDATECAEENLRKWLDTLIEPNSTRHAGKEGEEARDVIARCQEDIKTLWMNETVKAMLSKRKIKFEESVQLFLEDLDRIASHGYVPSEEEVALVSSRTGIREYRITIGYSSRSTQTSNYMFLYDIGDWRMARHAWMPFFEGVDVAMSLSESPLQSHVETIAIANAAPLSSFDERSPENRKVNRLEHSLFLWQTICGSRLFNRSSLILFLTKYDVLERKLSRGIQVKDSVPGYGDRRNDGKTAAKYFGAQFNAIAKEKLSEGRYPNIHLLSTKDSESATFAISTSLSLEENILRECLSPDQLM